jgi:hypothetical protein
MDQLIGMVTKRLDLEEGVVRNALGAVLNFLKNQSKGSFDFDKIISAVPSTKELMEEAPADAEEAAAASSSSRSAGTSTNMRGIISLVFTLLNKFGVMAILKQLLTTFFGESAAKMLESAEKGAELTGLLGNLGVSREQGVSMTQMLVDFLKDKVSPETVDQLVDAIPAVKTFLGEAKKDE